MNLIRAIATNAVLVVLCFAALHAQDCTQYNFTSNTTQATFTDYKEHRSGLHLMYVEPNGSCSYSGSAGSACVATCSATMDAATMAEDGTLNNSLYKHYTGIISSTGGGVAAAGGTVNCGTGAGGAVNSCLRFFGCAVTVSVSANGTNGIGVLFTFPPDAIWTKPYNWSISCPAHTAPAPPQPPPVCQPNTLQPPPTGNGFWYWNVSTCSWQWQSCQNVPPNSNGCQGQSPIVIDTEGEGFHLTSAPKGVLFDFYGNGRLMQLAWTAPGSANGWLALDRNGNGVIDSAKELFGKITEQPPSSAPNGFKALGVFDLPENGGNGDGVIDSKDAVWHKLLVWIDANHDGVSQSEELHSLEEVGIRKIGLAYSLSPFVDEFGNRFRYKGSLKPIKEDDVDRTIYDVFLER